MEYPYVYVWKKMPGNRRFTGKLCRIVSKTGNNSVLLEFQDGERLNSIRYAIRKYKLKDQVEIFGEVSR